MPGSEILGERTKELWRAGPLHGSFSGTLEMPILENMGFLGKNVVTSLRRGGGMYKTHYFFNATRTYDLLAVPTA